VCHHRCGGILDDGLAFVVKYGQLSTISVRINIFYNRGNIVAVYIMRDIQEKLVSAHYFRPKAYTM
jgi:hypothetical protein